APQNSPAASANAPRGKHNAPGLKFPGVIGILEQTLAETPESYRDWLMRYTSPIQCPACSGKRLKPASLAVKVAGLSISDFTALPVSEARPFVDSIRAGLSSRELAVAGRPLSDVAERLDFLLAVGLSYLSLDRSAATLSGGEAQRIRLATQIG